MLIRNADSNANRTRIPSPRILLTAGDITLEAVIDTASTYCLISVVEADRLERAGQGTFSASPSSIKLQTYTKQPFSPSHQILVRLSLNGAPIEFEALVVPDPLVPLVLGMSFLAKYDASLNIGLAMLSSPLFGTVSLHGSKISPPNASFDHESYIRQNVNLTARTDLTPAQKDELLNLLLEFKEVFSPHPGRTNLAYHRIPTGDAAPVASYPYRASPARQREIEHAVADMLEKGIVTPVQSSWASPCILLEKKNSTEKRFAVDYRKLNNVTTKIAYPFPRVDDVLQSLGSPAYITTLDLNSAFWQLPIHPDDKHKSTFITHFGTFQFEVAAFGDKNSQFSFEKLMHLVLPERHNYDTSSYVDDVMTASVDWPRHMTCLKYTLSHLRQANLTVRIDKCTFAAPEAKVLGFIVDKRGVHPDPDKIAIIRNFPRPSTVKETRRMLGLFGYFRRFVPNYSKVAEPLTYLTKSTSRFEWRDEQETAFQKLIAALTSDPILANPVHGQPYTVTVDSSATGTGAILSQVQGDQERVIEYYSRLFTPTERRWSATEREGYGLVLAVEKFKHFVQGVPFTVFTDHRCLTSIQKIQDSTGKFARWNLRLAPYDFKIVYKRGTLLSAVDCLSRITHPEPAENTPPPHQQPDVNGVSPPAGPSPHPTPSSPANQTVIDPSPALAHIFAIGVDLDPLPLNTRDDDLSEQNLARCQNNDDHYCSVIKFLDNGEVPPNRTRAQMTRICTNYHVQDGLLHYNYKNQSLIAVPCSLRESVLRFYHDHPLHGHRGVKPTCHKITQLYFWPAIKKDIQNYIRRCIPCQRAKAPNTPPAGLMKLPTLSASQSVWSIDLMGPLPVTTQHNRWIIACVNVFSKYLELRPLHRATATTVARAFTDMVICRYGIPEVIISDHGPQFVSHVWTSTCRLLNIQHRQVTVYRPQSNRTERANKEVKILLSTYVNQNHRKWDSVLPLLQFALNSTVQESTGFSPHHVTFGTEPRVPLFPIPANAHPSGDPDPPSSDYADSLKKNLSALFTTVRENNERASRKQKSQYDRHRRDVQFSEGQFVWCRAHPVSSAADGVTAKLLFKYDGPFRIRTKLSPLNYVLEDTVSTADVGIRHVDQLKPYYGPDPTPPPPDSATPNETQSDSQATIIYDPHNPDLIQSDDAADPSCSKDPCTWPDCTDFIQCDKCDCWTHTDCAGISIDLAPHIDFFCEQCQNSAVHGQDS